MAASSNIERMSVTFVDEEDIYTENFIPARKGIQLYINCNIQYLLFSHCKDLPVVGFQSRGKFEAWSVNSKRKHILGSS